MDGRRLVHGLDRSERLGWRIETRLEKLSRGPHGITNQLPWNDLVFS